MKADDNNNVSAVVTDDGEYADTVLFAVGVKPATEWLDGKVELGKKALSKSTTA